MATTSEVTLALRPERRLEVIDVTKHIEEQYGDVLHRHENAFYCSYHTTAGYLDQRLSERLDYDPESIRVFLQPFQQLFPPDANYRHDQLSLRTELSEKQRANEPRNADSHLTFMSSGLLNCARYDNPGDHPVFFIDLDGVNPEAAEEYQQRSRRTTVIAYNEEIPVFQDEIRVPVSNHRVDSINLKAHDLGIFERVHELVQRYGIEQGRVEFSLNDNESHAALTVNEDETLLMQHDLREVLQNPMRFMAEKGWRMISDPKAIPGKAKNYAKYDLVQLTNKVLDKMGLSESVIERVIEKLLAVPAERFLRMQRSVSLLVNDYEEGSCGTIIQGRYQSPLLVQWNKPSSSRKSSRTLKVTLYRFN